MMSFLLLEHEEKPFKVRGELVVPATVVPLDVKSLVPGDYYCPFDDIRVKLKIVGLLADAVPEAKAAYSVMRAIAVTLDKAGCLASSNQVFVPAWEPYEIEMVTAQVSEKHLWPKPLMDYWIPSGFFQQDELVAYGWFKINEDKIEVFTINGSLENGPISMHPRYASDLQYECPEFNRVEKWVCLGRDTVR